MTKACDHDANLWTHEGAHLAELGEHEYGAVYGCFSPDGARALTVCAADTLRLWRTEPPYPCLASARFQNHDYTGRWPSFSPDGQHLLLPDGTLLDGHGRGWEQSRQEVVQRPRSQQRTTVDAQFSPQGDRIATAHDDTARIWDRSGQELLALDGHESDVWLVRFSPDGNRLLTVSESGLVMRLWDARSGRLLLTLPATTDPILQVKFSPDGRYLLAHTIKDLPGWGTIIDGAAYLWPIDPAALLALADLRVQQAPTVQELALYLDPPSPDG